MFSFLTLKWTKYCPETGTAGSGGKSTASDFTCDSLLEAWLLGPESGESIWHPLNVDAHVITLDYIRKEYGQGGSLSGLIALRVLHTPSS